MAALIYRAAKTGSSLIYANTTPPSFVAKITIPLLLIAGGPALNLTGLKWAWYDQATPDLFTGPPTDRGNAETTDGSGVIVIPLPNSAKTASGQIGHIEITDSNGDPTVAYRVFAGPWAVD